MQEKKTSAPDNSTRAPRFAALAAPLLALVMASSAAAPMESALEAPGPAAPLTGTMLAPDSDSDSDSDTRPGPVALIIPGSGPTDRDGNNPLGVKAATYRLLAQALAARGVATVRIDKRGMFGSAAAVADANAVTVGDYVADVHAWVGSIRKRIGADCVWLIGHSEGGLVAMAAAQDAPAVCGLVLIAAPGRPLGAVLREQIRANPANAPLLPQAMAAIDALEAGRRIDTAGMHPALQGLFGAQVQGFLISAFSYDPARLLAAYRKPVLVLQGQRDLQVSEADARLLAKAAPDASLVLLPDVNHVLKQVASSDPRANLATYADPALALAPGVGAAIAGFILRRPEGPAP